MWVGLLGVFVLATVSLGASAAQEMETPAKLPVLSAEEALERIRRDGRLASVAIEDRFDLSQLDAPAEFAGVEFRGPVGGPALVPIRFSGCIFITFTAGGRWRREIEFRDVTFHGRANFDEAEFEGAWKCLECRFNEGASFQDTHFARTAEFLLARVAGSVNFLGARFDGRADFDGTTFDLAQFNAVNFQEDASFLAITADAASFVGTRFGGETVFRFCVLSTGIFGQGEDKQPAIYTDIAVFRGFVDFSGCSFGTAEFDRVQFDGGASFRKASFDGDASFVEVGGGGPLDLRGLEVKEGALRLDGADLSSAVLDWERLSAAILTAEPSSDTLRGLARRLEANDQIRQALRARYYAKRQDLLRPGADLADRATDWLDWVLWTWPTRNGSDLLRLAWLALAAWLAGAVPLALARGALCVAPRSSGTNSDGRSSLLRPLYPDELPLGCYAPIRSLERIAAALSFSFSLLFKVRLTSACLVWPGRALSGRSGLEIFAVGLWVVGAWLLGLLVLTLANVSPPLRSLAGLATH